MRPRKLAHTVPTARRQSGVMLLEALLAIVVFSIGVLTLVAFQAVSLKNTLHAKYRTDAGFIANRIIGEMWVTDPTTLASYAGTYNTASAVPWGAEIVSTLPAGSGVVTVNGDIVTVTLSWKAPGDSTTHQLAQTVRINH